MAFQIEPTVSNDLSHILKLNQAALPAVSSTNIENMQHFLRIVDYFRTLKVGKNIAGFLIALTPDKDYHSLNYKWFEQKYNSFMYVDRVVIDRPFQDKGYGTAFYNNLSAFTKGKSPRITCEVNIRPPNEGSMIFHNKYGFKPVGTQTTEGGKKEVSLMEYHLPDDKNNLF
jgi:hypothetical protein